MKDAKNCQNELTMRGDGVQVWKGDNGGNHGLTVESLVEDQRTLESRPLVTWD